MNLELLFSREAFLELVAALDMPTVYVAPLTDAFDAFDQEALMPIAKAMCDAQTGEQATLMAKEHFGQRDADGFSILALSLCAVQITREKLWQQGLSEQCFIDTMKCFSRFATECVRWYGKPCYERAFWTWRQLSGVLIRLGTLEFEILHLDADGAKPYGLSAGQKVLSVHIPSDAICCEAELKTAYRMAKAHFGLDIPIVCETWLLSPELKKLVKPGSGIRQFAQDYRITSVDPEDDSFRQWVYGPMAGANEALPEQTSLQRTIKAHLLGGGKLGAAAGIYTQ